MIKEKGPDGKLRIVVYGLAGGLLAEPKDVQAVADAAKQQGLATTFYVVSLVPLADGAPAIPLVVTANKNDFDAPDVQRVLYSIYRAAAKAELKGRIFGDAS